MSSVHRRELAAGESWFVAYRVEGRQHSRTFDTEEQAGLWEDVPDAVGPAKALMMPDQDQDEAATRIVGDQVDSYIDTLTSATDGTRHRYRRIRQAHLQTLTGTTSECRTARLNVHLE